AFARYSAEKALRFVKFRLSPRSHGGEPRPVREDYLRIRQLVNRLRAATEEREVKMLISSFDPLSDLVDTQLRSAYSDRQHDGRVDIVTLHPVAASDELSRWFEPPFTPQPLSSEEASALAGNRPILCVCEEPKDYALRVFRALGYDETAIVV